MGGEQAAKTMLQIQVAGMKAKGQQVTAEEEKIILDTITAKYLAQTKAQYAASRLWVDAIIDPADTRIVISEGIAAADHNADIAEFKVGVFQV